jgi:hypothetical protein
MSAFSGSRSKGAMREHRTRKHAEATERNARTPAERTRQYRRDEATHVLVAVFGGDGATGGASDG